MKDTKGSLMNSRWLLTSTLFLGLAFAPAETRLEYSPTKGNEIEKSFSGEFTVYIEALDVTMNGQASPLSMDEMDPSEREGTFTYNLDVLDVFSDVADGRATELVRTYNAIEGSAEGGGETEEGSFDDLVGQTVQFVWDEETEQYDRSVLDEDADLEEDLVQSLAVEIDMSGLLPENEVAVGDTWEVPGEMMAGLLVPGIDFKSAANIDNEAVAEIPGEIMDALRVSMEEAIIECKYSELSGDGDDESAVIAFTMTAEVSLDLGEVMASQMDEAAAQMEMEMDEFTVDLSLELTGEMLWNVKGHRFNSYEMNGEIALDAYMTMSMGGGQMEIEGEAEATSEFTVEGSATVKADE